MISQEEGSLFIISPVSRKKDKKKTKPISLKWTKEEEKKFIFHLKQFHNKEIDFKQLKTCMLPNRNEKQVISHYHKMEYRYSRLIRGKDSKYLKKIGKFFEEEKNGFGLEMTDEISGKNLKIENFLLDALIRIQPVKKQKCQNLNITLDGPSLKLASQVAYINRKLSLLMDKEMSEGTIFSVSTPSCPFDELCRNGDSTITQEECYVPDTPQNFISTMARTNYRDALPSDEPFKDNKFKKTQPFDFVNNEQKFFSEQDFDMDSELSAENFENYFFRRLMPDLTHGFDQI
jgi:hypothetical protein